MATRVKMVPGGYEEIRHDGEKPRSFSARELIPFGKEKPLEGECLGVYDAFPSKVLDRNFRNKAREQLEREGNDYAEKMKAPFYELTRFELAWVNERSLFSLFRKPKRRYYSKGDVQLYVKNLNVI
jgi:hypothetical protein